MGVDRLKEWVEEIVTLLRGLITGGGSMSVNDGGGSLTTDPAPGSSWPVSDGGGSVTVDGSVTAIAQPGVDLGDVTVNNAGAGSAVNIQDGGNTITVDGTVAITAAALPLPAGAATSANQLPDGHNVTVDNAGAGSAVNIQDGGNTITVDGSVSAAVTGTVTAKGAGFSIPVTLTVTNGAYTIGDVVGGLITLPNMVSANGKHAIINTITLAGVVAIAYNLFFQSADIIAGTIADGAPYAPAAADGANYRGHVPVATPDYAAPASAFNDSTGRGVGLEVQAGAATTTVYAYLVATAVTSPGTTTLYLRVTGEMVD